MTNETLESSGIDVAEININATEKAIAILGQFDSLDTPLYYKNGGTVPAEINLFRIAELRKELEVEMVQEPNLRTLKAMVLCSAYSFEKTEGRPVKPEHQLTADERKTLYLHKLASACIGNLETGAFTLGDKLMTKEMFNFYRNAITKDARVSGTRLEAAYAENGKKLTDYFDTLSSMKPNKLDAEEVFTILSRGRA
jgi:hypothetical protein